jgi:ABC-type transport system involved in multi-copper enzyme maturation permease subunit
MVNVYLKNLKKSWLTGFVPPLVIVGFVGLIAIGWPSMQEIILQRLETMDNPVMKAIIGDLGISGLGATWEAAMFMYAGGTMNILLLFVAIFVPTRLLSTEIDKNTFDIMLSLPIPRWRYLLEKFSVYVTYSMFTPFAMVGIMLGATAFLGETITTSLVLNYSLGYFILLFTLGALSLLCTTIFLDSNKSLAAAGVVIGGQYFLDSMGGILAGLGNVEVFSLFNYFSLGAIREAGMLPLGEILIVLTIGVLALSSALLIFHKREFAL